MGIGKHGISTIYKLLMTHLEGGAVCPTESWEIELNQPLSETMRSKVFHDVHSTSVDTRIKEMTFKLLIKWYYVPDKSPGVTSMLEGVRRSGNPCPYPVAVS